MNIFHQIAKIQPQIFFQFQPGFASKSVAHKKSVQYHMAMA